MTEIQEQATSPCSSRKPAGDEEAARLSGKEAERSCKTSLEVALLTGGGDRPYVLGLTSALSECGIAVDFIASNDLDLPEVHRIPHMTFRNLRGDQRPNVSHSQKALRVLTYYARLIRYAATAQPKVFHILWNDKFEVFDRTLLMLYYRLLGRKIVFTAHNVNARKRDGKDTWLNRFSLRIQYRLVHHIFVHTAKMKTELMHDFCVSGDKVSVIPLGVNNTVPVTTLTTAEARCRLGIEAHHRVLLFFGRIAPYKGLEYLVKAVGELSKSDRDIRLIIAGSIKDCAEYWQHIQEEIARAGIRPAIVERIEFIPDSETEVYFKAADVVVLPYTDIFQSGVLVLGYSFGLPVIAADVGSLREDIIEGKTGYVFEPKDAADLAEKIRQFFSSALFRDLPNRRQEIRNYANEQYSWSDVAEITRGVYQTLLNE